VSIEEKGGEDIIEGQTVGRRVKEKGRRNKVLIKTH